MPIVHVILNLQHGALEDASKMWYYQKVLVPPVGLEPTRLAAPDFESGASTNSTTGALNPSGF